MLIAVSFGIFQQSQQCNSNNYIMSSHWHYQFKTMLLTTLSMSGLAQPRPIPPPPPWAMWPATLGSNLVHSGPSATACGRAWQLPRMTASLPASTPTVADCHNKRARATHTGGIARTHSPRNKRLVCGWAARALSCPMRRFQGWETQLNYRTHETNTENIENKEMENIP